VYLEIADFGWRNFSFSDSPRVARKKRWNLPECQTARWKRLSPLPSRIFIDTSRMLKLFGGTFSMGCTRLENERGHLEPRYPLSLPALSPPSRSVLLRVATIRQPKIIISERWNLRLTQKRFKLRWGGSPSWKHFVDSRPLAETAGVSL
jgi:hypothetical protein